MRLLSEFTIFKANDAFKRNNCVFLYSYIKNHAIIYIYIYIYIYICECVLNFVINTLIYKLYIYIHIYIYIYIYIYYIQTSPVRHYQ